MRGARTQPGERNLYGCRRLEVSSDAPFGLLALLALAAAVLPATAAAERSVPRGWLGVIADGPLTVRRGDGRRVGPDGLQRRRVGADGLLLAERAARRERAAGPRAPRRRRAAGGAARAAGPADRDRHARLGREPRARRDVSPARQQALHGLPAHARRPLRPAGLAVGRAPGGRRAADPRLADLERAEPDPLLDAAARPGLRAQLREAARGGGPRAEVRRSRLAHDPRRPAERELDRAPEDLPGAAAAGPSTPWRCTRTRASRATSCVSRSWHGRRCAATSDGRKPIWITELSWPAAKGKTRNTTGFETTDRGQARRLGEGLRLLAKARKRLRIQRVFWYTWLSREGSPNSFDYSGLRRLRGGQDRLGPRPGGVPRGGAPAAGLREGVRRRHALPLAAVSARSSDVIA